MKLRTVSNAGPYSAEIEVEADDIETLKELLRLATDTAQSRESEGVHIF